MNLYAVSDGDDSEPKLVFAWDVKDAMRKADIELDEFDDPVPYGVSVAEIPMVWVRT